MSTRSKWERRWVRRKRRENDEGQPEDLIYPEDVAREIDLHLLNSFRWEDAMLKERLELDKKRDPREYIR